MNIKDLTNRDVATIANCESEPIHLPGSIQPHGILLAVDNDQVIRICSANVDRLGFNSERVLQQPLTNLFPALAETVQLHRSGNVHDSNPVDVEINGLHWDVYIHTEDQLMLLELEEGKSQEMSGNEVFDQTSRFVSFTRKTKSLQDLCRWTAVEIKNLTGYDRVMIYRFDADYNGEVFAEAREESLEPFLNLHYPHTDIPVQARELYLRNPMRMIADVGYTPVALLSIADDQIANPDLSDVGIRSVSPIHIQYLKNMQVGATLTISIILDGQLWGLVACHHRTPKRLGHHQRRAAFLHANLLTSQIKVRMIAEEHEVSVGVEAHLQQLLNALKQQGDFSFIFQHLTSLLAVANASGVSIFHKGQLFEKGTVPPKDRTKKLFQWLGESTAGLRFCTAHLSKHYAEGEKISEQASGILYHKLGDPNKDAIIWFREEIEQTINWAGDPKDTLNKKNTPERLTPRSSFAIFKEKVRHRSKEWLVPEINAASRFANTMQNQVHLEYLQIEENRQRVMNEQLRKANKELANINWITSHDLKEPVRKILMFTSMMRNDEEKKLSESVLQSLEKIKQSANRMQTLVDDIITYSLTDDKSVAFVETDLNAVLEEVVENFRDEFRDQGTALLIQKLPEVRGIPYQLRQLFINLIANSIKFSRPKVPLKIEISSVEARGMLPIALQGENSNRNFYLIRFSDNGIGFDASQNEKIFDIFYRLHNQKEYEGTGIGLAICKRIAENHDGLITASGEPGVGTTFNIYLPVN